MAAVSADFLKPCAEAYAEATTKINMSTAKAYAEAAKAYAEATRNYAIVATARDSDHRGYYTEAMAAAQLYVHVTKMMLDETRAIAEGRNQDTKEKAFWASKFLTANPPPTMT
jgi:hypothetical protein